MQGVSAVRRREKPLLGSDSIWLCSPSVFRRHSWNTWHAPEAVARITMLGAALHTGKTNLTFKWPHD